MLRKIGAVLGGMITGFIVIYLVQALGHSLFPVDQQLLLTAGSVEEAMELIPAGALAFVLLAYMAGSFTAGAVATLIMQSFTLKQATTCGIIFTILGLINIFMIPHPVWFIILSLLIYVPMAWLGGLVLLKLKKNQWQKKTTG